MDVSNDLIMYIKSFISTTVEASILFMGWVQARIRPEKRRISVVNTSPKG